jgi:hypothetical protein
VEDTTRAEVAIYVDTDRVIEVIRQLPLPFEQMPFPFEDKPSQPTTSVLRYIGEWKDEYDQIARRLLHTKVIRRFSRTREGEVRHPGHKKSKK